MQWSQIAELDASLQHLLDDAHSFGSASIDASSRKEWDQTWQELRETLGRIRALSAETHERFAKDDDQSPLESWSDLLEHERDLGSILTRIRELGSAGKPSEGAGFWEEQCAAIKLHAATLHSQALAVRFQLELRQKYGEQKADALTKEIAARLPEDANLANAEKHTGEYCQAVKEYEEERETFGGVWDILKSLLLIPIETPAERISKN